MFKKIFAFFKRKDKLLMSHPHNKMTAVTDIDIVADPDTDELILIKTFTPFHFTIVDGHVNVVAGESFVRRECVTIPNVYGYGPIDCLPEHESTTQKPNFYNKK